MTQVDTPPLRWPDWYLNASQSRRFFADVPLIGLYSQVRKNLCKELAKRSSQSLELWGESISRLRCLNAVSPIIQGLLGWPNTFFIPDDPCEILFWDTGMELRSGEALYQIHAALNVPADVTEYDDRTTYGEFIDRIVKHINAA